MPTTLELSLANFPAVKQAGYRLRLAEGEQDLLRLQRLRYEVFNIELGEGFEESAETGLDSDIYDRQVHHLLIEEINTQDAVGTYRLQTLPQAQAHNGFYTAEEYDLSALDDILPASVEASRACVHKDHREGPPIQLLWKGIARYLELTRSRYLFGLCSLTSQDPTEGVRAWKLLQNSGMVHADRRVLPRREFQCELPVNIEASPLEPLQKLPPLFDAYMRVATRIVGYPAIDRAFKTIDFLALLDIEEIPSVVRRRYFS